MTGLPVQLYGTRLGILERHNGRALLRWTADAEQRWALNSPVLSRSLRVGTESVDATESFFGALLPEGAHIGKLAQAAQVAPTDLVGLLEYVGADLAGALRIGDTVHATAPEPLNEQQIVALLDDARGFLLGGGSALPGFQRKLTLTRAADGSWIKGNGAIASTHILKPIATADRRAVDAEAYVLALGRALGLVNFDVEVELIGGYAVLVVERYDRAVDGADVQRIHQEDAAQALGLPWGTDAKFERAGAGASLAAIARELDTRATAFDTDPYTDRLRLLAYTTLSVAAGNSDAHAKNFSLLHDDTGRTALAPMYDAAPLALTYDGSEANALFINGQRSLPDTTAADLVAEASTWGVPPAIAEQRVRSVLEHIIEATRTVDAPDSIAAHVPGYVRGQAQNLLDGRPARLNTPIPPILMPGLGTPHA